MSDNTARKAGYGDIVVDIGNPHRVTMGTVVGLKGGMVNNDAVQVFWHHLGYSNWEQPDGLCVVHTGDRAVEVHIPTGIGIRVWDITDTGRIAYDG